MTTTKKYKHGDLREHRGTSGRYIKADPCDACGKPCNEATRMTDDEVCGGTDGPGFYLCDRKRCVARYTDLGVEARRQLFATQRAINDGKALRWGALENMAKRRAKKTPFRVGDRVVRNKAVGSSTHRGDVVGTIVKVTDVALGTGGTRARIRVRWDNGHEGSVEDRQLLLEAR